MLQTFFIQICVDKTMHRKFGKQLHRLENKIQAIRIIFFIRENKNQQTLFPKSPLTDRSFRFVGIKQSRASLCR